MHNNTNAYIDIEATGFSRTKTIPTVVGILIENDLFKQFLYGVDLKGKNIDQFLYEYDVTNIIGYNHKSYDIPYLEKNPCTKCQCFRNIYKKDLMKLAHQLNIKGGLKKTEEHLGIIREAEPLDYNQQMELWNRWNYFGDRDALNQYLFYNEEDVMNLPVLENKLHDIAKRKNIKLKI